MDNTTTPFDGRRRAVDIVLVDNATKFGTTCKASISRPFDGLRLKVDVNTPEDVNAEFSRFIVACCALSPQEFEQTIVDHQAEWDVFREEAVRLVQHFAELQSREIIYSFAQKLLKAGFQCHNRGEADWLIEQTGLPRWSDADRS